MPGPREQGIGMISGERSRNISASSRIVDVQCVLFEIYGDGENIK